MLADKTTYRVTGMTFGGCARSLTRALEQALPGQLTRVSHTEGAVTVHGEHNPTTIAQVVAAAGFSLIGMAREGAPPQVHRTG